MASGRGLEPRYAAPKAAVLPLNEPEMWWTGRESNPQPSACGADVLPVELRGPNLTTTRGDLSRPISRAADKAATPVVRSGWDGGNRTPDLMRPRHAPYHSATSQSGSERGNRTRRHRLMRPWRPPVRLLASSWSRREESNLQPSLYGSAALPVELPRLSGWRRVRDSNSQPRKVTVFRTAWPACSPTLRAWNYRCADIAVGVLGGAKDVARNTPRGYHE
jgi:hypothetical protein